MLSNINKYKYKFRLVLFMLSGVYLPTTVFAQTSVITDMSVNALISEAIQTHPLVGSARAEQDATQEGITAAKLNLLPNPTVSAGYDEDSDFVSQLTIRQSLWTGGKLTADINQAIFDDKAAVENIYEQQNQVAKTTIEAWQSFITAVAQQRVYLDNLKQLADFESMMQRRVKQGVSARIELDLVTNRILQEQNSYQAAVEQQRIAAARLEQITGHPISQGSAYTVPQLKVLVDQAKIESMGFEEMAFNNASFYNPSVIKEYFQVEAAKQEVKSRRASRYPSVYAQYQRAFHNDNDEDDEDDGGRLSVGLDYQPGAGFSSLALTRASESRVNSLIKNQEAARRSVMETIQVQYQQFASAKSRELSLVAAVAGAQIVVNSYRRQFIAGRKSWLEVLNAVREHSDYQIQLVQTRSNILGSFYKLQVDFGLMPWQKFAHNREPIKMFSVVDPVRDWMQNQQNVAGSREFGYDTGTNDVMAVGNNYSTNSYLPIVNNNLTMTNNNLSDKDTYVQVNSPATARQQLDNGEVLILEDNQSIEVVDTNNIDANKTDSNSADSDDIGDSTKDTTNISQDSSQIDTTKQTTVIVDNDDAIRQDELSNTTQDGITVESNVQTVTTQ